MSDTMTSCPDADLEFALAVLGESRVRSAVDLAVGMRESLGSDMVAVALWATMALGLTPDLNLVFR